MERDRARPSCSAATSGSEGKEGEGRGWEEGEGLGQVPQTVRGRDEWEGLGQVPQTVRGRDDEGMTVGRRGREGTGPAGSERKG